MSIHNTYINIIQNNYIIEETMKLNHGYEAFAYMAAVFAPTLYLSLLVFYLFEGRYSGYLPTISETGLEFPNNDFMVTFFTAIAASALFGLKAFAYYLEEFYQPNSIIKFIINLIPISSSISFLLISVFPMNTQPFGHFSSTFVAFFGFCLFQLITLFYTRNDTTLFMNIFRFLFILMQIVQLIICAIAEHVWSHRINVTIQMIGEYMIVSGTFLFFLSYMSALKNICFQIKPA
ncbi:hypothetical protein TRFO_27595 [Tritrichomonas foetus]|uniref:Frag1/DRAM/Sfk1 family protein n=1 Tax=Tritrichomonas foetus TaxID=1144522 RepID=A0A1J4K069_9EUKA|nr:hypothetical protein TRFO_27595 [Tritrichomonas foetus]|eukprot:OHT04815.1 hypothetical protein TRFO_27595 [Tritrichomonas foetus]